MRFVAGGAPWRSCWPGHRCWPGRREDWPGAEVELLARAGAGQASRWSCWPGRCGRARPPVQNSKGGQCDQRTASISAQIAGERTASVLCADCRRRGLEFEGDFCQEVDLCLRIYALPAEVFRTIYKVVLAIPSVRVVLFVEEVVYNSGEGNAGAAL